MPLLWPGDFLMARGDVGSPCLAWRTAPGDRGQPLGPDMAPGAPDETRAGRFLSARIREAWAGVWDGQDQVHLAWVIPRDSQASEDIASAIKELAQPRPAAAPSQPRAARPGGQGPGSQSPAPGWRGPFRRLGKLYTSTRAAASSGPDLAPGPDAPDAAHPERGYPCGAAAHG